MKLIKRIQHVILLVRTHYQPIASLDHYFIIDPLLVCWFDFDSDFNCGFLYLIRDFYTISIGWLVVQAFSQWLARLLHSRKVAGLCLTPRSLLYKIYYSEIYCHFLHDVSLESQ